MDDLIERIENERAEADYALANGGGGGDVVRLSLTDCSAIAALLHKAYGSLLMGKRDAALAEQITLLSSAFAGEDA